MPLGLVLTRMWLLWKNGTSINGLLSSTENVSKMPKKIGEFFCKSMRPSVETVIAIFVVVNVVVVFAVVFVVVDNHVVVVLIFVVVHYNCRCGQ